MNLKNIIKLLIIFIPFFSLSCQKFDNYRNKDEKIILTAKDEIENLETFNNLSENGSSTTPLAGRCFREL